MPTRGIIRIGVIGVLALVWCTAASAQMFMPTGRATLRGLPGVEVLVENTTPELERVGLTASGLRADLEQRLRAAGIAIYATQKESSTCGGHSSHRSAAPISPTP